MQKPQMDAATAQEGCRGGEADACHKLFSGKVLRAPMRPGLPAAGH